MSERPDRGGIHRRAIADLVATIPGATDKGFWAAHDELCDQERVERFRHRFLPDAFRFNAEAQEIELYEVEVHCALSPDKIALLGDFWEAWDEEGDSDWLPVLIVVDRFGNRNRMDLKCALYGTGWAREHRTTFLSRWLA